MLHLCNTLWFCPIRTACVLVPGDGGSQIEAKLDKPTVPHRWCTRKTDYWYSLWLNLELLAPYILDCLIDNMRYVNYIDKFLST